MILTNTEISCIFLICLWKRNKLLTHFPAIFFLFTNAGNSIFVQVQLVLLYPFEIFISVANDNLMQICPYLAGDKHRLDVIFLFLKFYVTDKGYITLGALLVADYGFSVYIFFLMDYHTCQLAKQRLVGFSGL